MVQHHISIKKRLISHHYLTSTSDQQSVIKDIEFNNVNIIVECYPFRADRDLDVMKVLGSYIKDNFNLCKNIDGYKIWCRV